MLVLITGGSCSGKSAYAEKQLCELGSGKNRYYIATMEAEDEESRKRVERHRLQRAGKGFVTIEQGRDIQLAAEHMEGSARAALLECMSNLAANEMFGGENPVPAETVTEKICRGIQELENAVDCLIVVTNNVFEDGVNYDAATTAYLEALGKIGGRLAAMADSVTEVVAGIAVCVKRPEKTGSLGGKQHL